MTGVKKVTNLTELLEDHDLFRDFRSLKILSLASRGRHRLEPTQHSQGARDPFLI